MWFTIFKRKKSHQMPSPKFEDNWKQDRYLENVKSGVKSLQDGVPVKIMDDGRGYELALDIKRQFILEYQKQLAEKIQISGNSIITIKLQDHA